MRLVKRWGRFHGVAENGEPYDLYSLTLSVFKLSVEFDADSKTWHGEVLDEGSDTPLGIIGTVEAATAEEAQANLMILVEAAFTDSLILLNAAKQSVSEE